MSAIEDRHRGRPILASGAPLAEAAGVAILIHGRGASAADILGLGQAIDRPKLACLAPDAAGHAWYPRPFTVPSEMNQPYLASALNVVGRIIADLSDDGIPAERIVLLGFSQGACLALEFAARNPRRYGGVVALSGGLIGDQVAPENYAGSLSATPVFLGCSDVDPFIPLSRVQQSTGVMRLLGGDVTERIYPGAGHTVVEDEVANVRRIVDRMVS